VGVEQSTGGRATSIVGRGETSIDRVAHHGRDRHSAGTSHGHEPVVALLVEQLAEPAERSAARDWGRC